MVQLVHLQQAERHFSMWRFEVEFVAPPQSHEIPPCCCNAWGKAKTLISLVTGKYRLQTGCSEFYRKASRENYSPHHQH